MERTALVTGGTRGIGRAISEALHGAGYKVAAVYVGNDAAAQHFTKETGIASFKFDVSDFNASTIGIEKIVEQLGPIEILINNAGVTRDAMLHKMTPDQWATVVTTNLGSCFNMARLVINDMRARRFGRIVNIGSINGQAGQLGQTNYSAAKAGIQGFTKALALENASHGITVNTIAPGYTDTDMVRAIPKDVLPKVVARIPIGRLGQPREIARGVLFLASDEADFITGSTLSINGGQYMC